MVAGWVAVLGPGGSQRCLGRGRATEGCLHLPSGLAESMGGWVNIRLQAVLNVWTFCLSFRVLLCVSENTYAHMTFIKVQNDSIVHLTCAKRVDVRCSYHKHIHKEVTMWGDGCTNELGCGNHFTMHAYITSLRCIYLWEKKNTLWNLNIYNLYLSVIIQ